MNILAQIRYGFYGLHGFLGVILGLILCIIIIWGIWSIFDIIAAKFGKPEIAWMFQILRIILIVVTVIWFVNQIFALAWF
jgi:hypothetical protein